MQILIGLSLKSRRGKLKIAEVASRFKDVGAFVKLVEMVGYQLASKACLSNFEVSALTRTRIKDASNTHFIRFDFVKITRKDYDLDWESVTMQSGKLLKPCEYKRR